MPQAEAKSFTVLVVSRDPKLADVRRTVLEEAGVRVVQASDAQSARAACQKHDIRAAMLGYSLTPATKRQVANAIKESCKVPVLELHQQEPPELLPPTYFHHANTPDDFLDAIRAILRTLR